MSTDVEQTMKTIQATKGYAAIVDDEDYESLSRFSWYAHNSTGRNPRPARRTSVAEGRKVVFLYHEIMRPSPGMVIDHINGDPWDNRRCNLRECTHTENMRNRKPHRGTKSGFKGVRIIDRKCRYAAAITCDGKLHHIGTFADPEEAARAYDEAATRLHGEFARLNFPEAA